jgi:hypothetical protein
MFKPSRKHAIAVLALLVTFATAVSERERGLPIVDLGYELHQAANFNVSLNSIALASATKTSHVTKSPYRKPEASTTSPISDMARLLWATYALLLHDDRL